MSASRFSRFTLRKEPTYGLNRRLGRPDGRSRRFGDEITLFYRPGTEPWLSSARNLVTTLTEPFQVLMTSSNNNQKRI